jgi:GntR family transcriptional regulator
MGHLISPLLQIVDGDSRPISRQIVDGVRRLIGCGDLSVGVALPSIRALAGQLRINSNTVAKAYAELTAEGWLESRIGIGIFVAVPRQLLSLEERERRLSLAVANFVNEVLALDFTEDLLLDRLANQISTHVPRTSAQSSSDGELVDRGNSVLKS